MKNKEIDALNKMIQYIDKSIKYTKDYTFEQFCKEDMVQDATIFAISQIGELIKNISDETMNKYNSIEWKMIKGLRNRIVHDYSGINLTNIWYIIDNDLLELKKELQLIIDDMSKNK